MRANLFANKIRGARQLKHQIIDQRDMEIIRIA